MHVARLQLQDFRSYADIDVSLSPGASAICTKASGHTSDGVVNSAKRDHGREQVSLTARPLDGSRHDQVVASRAGPVR